MYGGLPIIRTFKTEYYSPTSDRWDVLNFIPIEIYPTIRLSTWLLLEVKFKYVSGGNDIHFDRFKLLIGKVYSRGQRPTHPTHTMHVEDIEGIRLNVCDADWCWCCLWLMHFTEEWHVNSKDYLLGFIGESPAIYNYTAMCVQAIQIMLINEFDMYHSHNIFIMCAPTCPHGAAN